MKVELTQGGGGDGGTDATLDDGDDELNWETSTEPDYGTGMTSPPTYTDDRTVPVDEDGDGTPDGYRTVDQDDVDADTWEGVDNYGHSTPDTTQTPNTTDNDGTPNDSTTSSIDTRLLALGAGAAALAWTVMS